MTADALACLETMVKAQASGSHRSRAELIYDTLRGAIQGGQLESGARVREQDVARLFGVSRTPVREALQRLQERGLLSVEGGRGGLAVLAIDNRRTLELYAVREILEGAAARFAAENASRRQIALLRQLLEDIAATPDAGQRGGINRIFHRTTYEAAHNAYLSRLLTDLYDELAVVGAPFHGTDPERSRQGYEEHQRIVDAIAAGDPDAAEQAARQHIRAYQKSIVEKLSRADG
jgi:DNA-binding GntR family transcriptional regulator